MIQAKIEIVSRNINIGINYLFSRPFQHLFLLYTESRDTPLFVSASPAFGNPITDNIGVKWGKYTQYDSNGKENADFTVCQKSPCMHKIQVEGEKSSIFAVWMKILEVANQINVGEIKYDLPVCETAVGFFQMLGTQIDQVTTETATSEDLPQHYSSEHWCNTRNSNTVAIELLRSVGITPKIPTYSNGEEVDAPAMHNVFSNEKPNNQASQRTAVKDMFDAIDATNVLGEEISNRERFLKMARYVQDQGNFEASQRYENLAKLQGEVEKFFDSLSGEHKQDDKDEL